MSVHECMREIKRESLIKGKKDVDEVCERLYAYRNKVGSIYMHTYSFTHTC